MTKQIRVGLTNYQSRNNFMFIINPIVVDWIIISFDVQLIHVRAFEYRMVVKPRLKSGMHS